MIKRRLSTVFYLVTYLCMTAIAQIDKPDRNKPSPRWGNGKSQKKYARILHIELTNLKQKKKE